MKPTPLELFYVDERFDQQIENNIYALQCEVFR